MSDVFISYARPEDVEVARRVRAALEARGKVVWIDEQGKIEHGDKWRVALKEAIDGADAIVFLLSAAWTSSRPCRFEFEDARAAGKRLVPVIIAPVPRDAVTDTLGELPNELEERDWIFLRPTDELPAGERPDDVDAGIAAIVRAAELDPEFTRLHTRILGRARAWDASGRRASPLLRGEELRAAEAWRDRSAAVGVKPEPTELQLDFITASRQAASHRQLVLGAVSTVVAAVAIVLAIGALIERSHAIANQKSALSQALASEAENQFQFASGDNPAVGTLLGLEAYRYDPSDAATASVLTALEDQSVVAGYAATGDQADDVAIDGAGTRMTVGEPYAVQTFALPSRRRLLQRDFGSALVRAVSPNGQLVAVAPATRGLDIDDVADPKAVPLRIGTTGSVIEAAFTTAGLVAFVEACPHGYCLAIWTLAPKAHSLLSSPLVIGAAFPYQLAVAADGSELATLDAGENDSGDITLIDLDNGRHATLAVRGASIDTVTGLGALALSPSGDELAAGYDDGVYQVWRVDAGRATALGPAGGYRMDSSGQVTALRFDATGARLVTGTSDGYAALYTVGNATQSSYLDEDTATVEDAAFLPGGHEVALADADDQVLLWNLGDASPLGSPLHSPGGDVAAAAFSPNGRVLAAFGVNGAVRLYATGSGRALSPPLQASQVDEPEDLGPQPNPIAVLAFDRTGRRLVLADGSGHVRVWNVADPSHPRLGQTVSLAHVIGPGGGDGTVAISPTATEVAIPTARAVLLFDTDALGRPPRRLRYSLAPSSGGMTLAFDASGTELAAGDLGRATLEAWNLSRSARARTIAAPSTTGSDLYALAFAPGDGLLAAAIGGEVSVFRVADGHRVGTFGSAIDDAGGYVQSIAFNPSGSIVATGDDFGNLRLWSLATEQEIANPLLSTGNSDDGIFDVAFSPDGAQVVVAGMNSALQLWNRLLWPGTDLGARASRLCAIAGRNLTRAEWNVLVPGASYHRTCSEWPSGAE